MPRARRNNLPPPPAGWDEIEDTVNAFEQKLKEAVDETHEGKRLAETQWKLHQVNHQRSRFIYEKFYKKHEISRELYEWLLDMKYADKELIAKWKKTGYEKLCCLGCIQTQQQNFGTTCICRVPKKDLDKDRVIECQHCSKD